MSTADVRLEFDDDFDVDERASQEVRDKGYYRHAVAVLPDNRRVKLSFWNPVRLSQDLEVAMRLGRACIAEPALIIIQNVTADNMRAAANELYRRGYFNHLR